MLLLNRCRLLDLPWEDVLIPHILCYLPLQQLVSLQRVSKQFQDLIQVYLANCRTFDLPSVGPNWWTLQYTSVMHAYAVPVKWYDLGIWFFFYLQVGPAVPKEAFCSMLKENKVLHSLSLQNCTDWVTDKELLPVIGQNLHLQRVDMSGCVWLTRHSLVAVSLSCLHLQHLGLAHCEWVDSLSLRSLADHCPGLQSIDLTACRHLKDDAICYLAKKCLNLRSLSLAVNANITDESVEEVAKNCRGLEQLDLTGCLRVMNHSIRYKMSPIQPLSNQVFAFLPHLVYVHPFMWSSTCCSHRTLAEYCPKLQSLKVNHCHNVTESSLEPLRKRNVAIDVEPPLQRALVLLQDVLGFAPFINLQI